GVGVYRVMPRSFALADAPAARELTCYALRHRVIGPKGCLTSRDAATSRENCRKCLHFLARWAPNHVFEPIAMRHFLPTNCRRVAAVQPGVRCGMPKLIAALFLTVCCQFAHAGDTKEQSVKLDEAARAWRKT